MNTTKFTATHGAIPSEKSPKTSNGMKLDINPKKKTEKFTNMLRLNSTLLNNQWDKEEINMEIKKHLDSNENRNTTYQNLGDAAKAVLRRKFITVNVYIKTK